MPVRCGFNPKSSINGGITIWHLPLDRISVQNRKGFAFFVYSKLLFQKEKLSSGIN